MLQPLYDRLVITRKEKEVTSEGGIFIPTAVTEEKPSEGIVIKVGPGKLLPNGDIKPMSVQEGERILFAKYAGVEFEIEKQPYLLLREEDILGIFR
jgi:chaperonin GroES